MTVIYVDTLFLLNALVDYLLLLAAARLAGEPLRRVRFALGAILGGCFQCFAQSAMMSMILYEYEKNTK